MNGYGQVIPQNEKALYDALTQFQQMQQQQAMQNELMASNDPYARLGAVLGGAVKSKMSGTSMKDAEAQLLEAQFIRNQEIEKARAEQARIQAEAKRAQELADKQAEREHDLNKINLQHTNAKGMADYNNRLKGPAKASFEEMIFNQMTPEQQQAFINSRAGIKQDDKKTIFTPQEEALIAENPALANEIKQNKIEKATGVTSQDKAREQARIKTAQSLMRLRDLVGKHGTEWGGKKAATMETAFRDAQLNMKDAYELGVLSGQDEVILTDVVSNPTSFWSQFNLMAGGNIAAKLDEVMTRFMTPEEIEAYKAQNAPAGTGMSQDDQNLYNKY